MIKFIGEREGRHLFGIGLSRGNCDRLLKGNPIFIDLKVMNFECGEDFNDATILIFADETEAAMCYKLEAYGIGLPEAKKHNEDN